MIGLELDLDAASLLRQWYPEILCFFYKSLRQGGLHLASLTTRHREQRHRSSNHSGCVPEAKAASARARGLSVSRQKPQHSERMSCRQDNMADHLILSACSTRRCINGGSHLVWPLADVQKHNNVHNLQDQVCALRGFPTSTRKEFVLDSVHTGTCLIFHPRGSCKQQACLRQRKNRMSRQQATAFHPRDFMVRVERRQTFHLLFATAKLRRVRSAERLQPLSNAR